MLFQRGFGVAYGTSNIASGMQDVGGNYQIIASELKPLSCEWLLHIKDLIGQIGVLRRIHPLPIAQKGFGDITVAVLCDGCLIWLQHLQDLACGSSCTSPYLQDANACVSIVCKPIFQIDYDKLSQDLIEIVCTLIVLIDPFH